MRQPSPSKTWDLLLARYRKFKECPSWSGRYVITDRFGRPDKNEDRRKELRMRHVRRVEKALGWLCEGNLVPKSPRGLTQPWIDRLVSAARRNRSRGKKRAFGPVRLRYLWQAIVLDRWEYTCWYCGRDALKVYENERRTLRFEMDHWKVTRADGGDEFSLSNIRPACRTCNVARGRMPDGLFRRELKSLAASISRLAC